MGNGTNGNGGRDDKGRFAPGHGTYNNGHGSARTSRLSTVPRCDRQAFFFLQDWAEIELEVTVRPAHHG